MPQTVTGSRENARAYDEGMSGCCIDQETNLFYNYFRYYDPQTGRYITSDPIGLFGGINTYAYVGGNPVSRVDPEGLRVFVYGDTTGAYKEATTYLRKDPFMAAIIDKLEKSDEIYSVVINKTGDDSWDDYDPYTGAHNRINWDPTDAISGAWGCQSPALGLGHEMDHAAYRVPYFSQPRIRVWGNEEEKRVILGSETTAARILGEGIRTDHRRATHTKVASPTDLPCQSRCKSK